MAEIEDFPRVRWTRVTFNLSGRQILWGIPSMKVLFMFAYPSTAILSFIRTTLIQKCLKSSLPFMRHGVLLQQQLYRLLQRRSCLHWIFSLYSFASLLPWSITRCAAMDWRWRKSRILFTSQSCIGKCDKHSGDATWGVLQSESRSKDNKQKLTAAPS